MRGDARRCRRRRGARNESAPQVTTTGCIGGPGGEAPATPATNADRVACVETVTQLPATMTRSPFPLSTELALPRHRPRPVDVAQHGTRSVARTLTVIFLALCPFAATAAQDVAAPMEPAALAARQVERGEQWFRSACLQCHAIGAVSNPDFRVKWGGRTALDLFGLISRTMPDGNPGSLSRGTYLAVTAYLLKLNGMPVAQAPLVGDSTALGGLRLAFPATPR